jgi:hypothetical protein
MLKTMIFFDLGIVRGMDLDLHNINRPILRRSVPDIFHCACANFEWFFLSVASESKRLNSGYLTEKRPMEMTYFFRLYLHFFEIRLVKR